MSIFESTAWQWFLVGVSFFLAAGLSFLFVPPTIRLAFTHGIVDRPDGRLKTQREPIPYLGGVCVYLSFIVTLGVTCSFTPQVVAILLAGTMMVLLGLVDDLGALSPRAKFLGQTLAVLVLLKAGIMLELVWLPWWALYPLSFLWMAGLVNAVNIIDIMDGLAAGVGFLASLALLIVAALNGHQQIAVLTATLAGAQLGLLWHNRHPARIYLGDSGSLFIGMSLGALAMIGSYTEHSPVGVLSPVVILGVPIFDTVFVMYVRWRRGISMFLGSPDHFALRLRRWRLSVRQTVGLSWAVAAALGAAGVVLMYLDTALAVAFAAALGAVVLGAALWLLHIDTRR